MFRARHAATDDHPHDLGADLGRFVDLARQQATSRRQALGWLGAVALTGCGGGDSAEAGSSSSSSSGGTTTPTSGSGGGVSSCSVIPEETAGPYPGDGSNSNGSGVANVLALSGVIRSDIRTSLAALAGNNATAAGIPLTVQLRLVNTNGSCADLSGYAIYLWHCDRLGRYSMYSSGVTGESFLRGVQATDSGGLATFTTIYPGCYAGRMPHMHFEVYRSATTATSFSNKLKTSQLAFPNDVSTAVYATSGYETSVSNFRAISFSTDNVFSDGVSTQLATLTGDTTNGYVATLVVGISV